LELDYSKSLDKMARSIQLRHKEQKQKYGKRILETRSLSRLLRVILRAPLWTDGPAGEGIKRVGKLMNAEAAARCILSLAPIPPRHHSTLNARCPFCARHSVPAKGMFLLHVWGIHTHRERERERERESVCVNVIQHTSTPLHVRERARSACPRLFSLPLAHFPHFASGDIADR